MLKIKLGKIIDYVYEDENLIRKAMAEFFGKAEIYPEMENFEQVQGLFNEWLIFEFKVDSATIAAEYYLKNPDSLSNKYLDELKQILETQFFDILEVAEIKRGEWIKVYPLSKGKTYKVYDIMASSTIPPKGSFWGRLAKVDNRWYLVGSNPLFLPLTYTPRMKKMLFQESKRKSMFAKDVLGFLLPAEDKNVSWQTPLSLTLKQLKNKRKKIEKEFAKLAEKYNLKVSFKELVNFVYQENYKTNHADFYKDIAKLGIPEELIVKKTQLFVNLWNYFPHKSLRGKSPAEMYKEKYAKL